MRSAPFKSRLQAGMVHFVIAKAAGPAILSRVLSLSKDALLPFTSQSCFVIPTFAEGSHLSHIEHPRDSGSSPE